MRLRTVPVSAAVTVATLAIAFGFCLAADWPGYLSYDSVMQLLEGRTGVYANWHPPVMSWLLGLADAAVPGTGLFVFLAILLVFGALASLVLVVRKPSWAAAVVAAACVLTPQILIYPAIVWKDVLFGLVTVAGFVCLTHAARFWPRARLRFGLLAATLLFLVLAALARQNGIVMLLAGAVALGWVAGKSAPARPFAVGAGYGAVALGAALTAMLAGQMALAERVTGTLGPSTQIRLLQTYDLIGALHADPGLELPALHAAEPALERELRGDGVRLYSPERNDTLNRSPVLMQALNNASPEEVGMEWRRLIFEHPGLYLATRWQVFRWVFFNPDLAACFPYYMGVDGPPQMMKALGLVRRWDARDEAMMDYAAHYAGTPVLSHVAYAALALVMLVGLLVRRRPEDIAMAGLLAAALVFTASFFVISIACDYRYLYVLDLSALVAAFYIALDPRGFFRRSG